MSGTRTRAVLSILLAATLTSGCVSGLLVRGVTWPWDPGHFWVVIRDSGARARTSEELATRYFEGECSIVWNGMLMEGMEASVADDRLVRDETESGGQRLWCTWNSSLPGPSASARWLNDGESYFDLSLPKRDRVGPRVFDDEEFGVVVDLIGPRFGNSLFCSVYVDVESMTAVLNAGVDKDVHVYVGTGSRRCTL